MTQGSYAIDGQGLLGWRQIVQCDQPDQTVALVRGHQMAQRIVDALNAQLEERRILIELCRLCLCRINTLYAVQRDEGAAFDEGAWDVAMDGLEELIEPLGKALSDPLSVVETRGS